MHALDIKYVLHDNTINVFVFLGISDLNASAKIGQEMSRVARCPSRFANSRNRRPHDFNGIRRTSAARFARVTKMVEWP
jgi:hypothetical protein